VVFDLEVDDSWFFYTGPLQSVIPHTELGIRERSDYRHSLIDMQQIFNEYEQQIIVSQYLNAQVVSQRYQNKLILLFLCSDSGASEFRPR
jgi:hypothetical protein